ADPRTRKSLQPRGFVELDARDVSVDDHEIEVGTGGTVFHVTALPGRLPALESRPVREPEHLLHGHAGAYRAKSAESQAPTRGGAHDSSTADQGGCHESEPGSAPHLPSGLGLFRRALPVLERGLFAARQRQLARRRVARDGAARPGGRVLADAHRRHQHVAGTDERAVFDYGLRLVDAVIVAGDGAGADVDALAHQRVAQVGEVIGLAAVTELGLLEFDEISYVRVAAELRTRAQARVRPDDAARAHRGLLEDAVGVDDGSRADAHV